jgi:hypothetical protein
MGEALAVLLDELMPPVRVNGLELKSGWCRSRLCCRACPAWGGFAHQMWCA